MRKKTDTIGVEGQRKNMWVCEFLNLPYTSSYDYFPYQWQLFCKLELRVVRIVLNTFTPAQASNQKHYVLISPLTFLFIFHCILKLRSHLSLPSSGLLSLAST